MLVWGVGCGVVFMVICVWFWCFGLVGSVGVEKLVIGGVVSVEGFGWLGLL